MLKFPTSDPIDSLLRTDSYEEFAELLNVPSLDENGNILANAIVLTNTGNVALTAGALGLNSSGQLIKHNGSDIGDYLPTARFSTRIVGMSGFNGSQATTGFLTILGSFIIPPSRAVVGSRYTITGSTTIAATSGVLGLPQFRIGFVPIMSLSSTEGWMGTQDSSGPNYISWPDINMTTQLVYGTPTTFVLSATRGNSFGAQSRYDYNGEPGEIYTGSYSPNPSSDDNLFGAVNQANRVVLVFSNDNTFTPKSRFDLRWDFTVEELY